MFAAFRSLFLMSVLLIHTGLFSQILQYDDLLIERVEITPMNSSTMTSIGGQPFNSQVIYSKMRTKEGDLFSHVQFDGDLKTLAAEYDRVEPCVEVVNDRIYIDLKVWFKPRVRTIQWEGNECYENEKLLKECGFSIGTVFDRVEFIKGFQKLKAYYVKNGHFEAEIDFEVKEDCVANEVDIIITLIEGRCGKIKKIIFENFDCCEEEEILEMMITKTWNFFYSWMSNDGIYNEEAMQHDQSIIVNYLQNEGYADAQVDVKVVEADCSNRILVIITADKGQLYTFGKLRIEGNSVFCDDDVWSRVDIEEGDPYSPDQLRETAAAITLFYGMRGYIEAVIDYEPTLQGDCPVYDIHIKIEEGDQYRVGLIKVLGNCSTETNVILHECLLIPGEVFNTEKLKRTEEKLRNIGYFKCVNVFAVRCEDSNSLGDTYRDVHIEVEETSTGKFSAFFGFSNVESIFGGITIAENNFNHKGLGRVWKEGYRVLRGGGEYAFISASIGAKSRKYSLSWTKPWFNDSPWVVGFDIERTNVRYISNDYSTDAGMFNLHATYLLNAYMRFGWHYRIRNSVVHLINSEKQSPQLQEEARNAGLISATGVSLIYDSTDHPQKPREGYRSRIEVEYAGIGGDQTFFGLGYLNSYYIPATKCGTLKLRADFRFILPVFKTSYAGMPLDERLYLGGDNTVRGYQPYALGPKFEDSDDPRGGMSLNLLTAEYSHKIFKRLDGFIFADAGNLAKQDLSIGHLRCSVGFGIRFVVFESGPPITLGLGFPINPHHKNDVKHFFFSMGGNF